MITQSRFERVIELSASCPQTELRPNTALVLCSLSLVLGQKLRLRWLGAKIARVLNLSNPAKINSSMGIAYVGLYAGRFNDFKRPAGAPLAKLVLNQAQLHQLNPYYLRDITAPDEYSVVAVNNTNNLSFELVVSGSLRVLAD